MVGKKELNGHFAGFHNLFGVGFDNHTLRNRHYAGSNEGTSLFNLNNTDTASADFVSALHVAESGNFDTCQSGGFENCVICGHAKGHAVYCNINIFHYGTLLSYFLIIALNLQVPIQAPHLIHLAVSISYAGFFLPGAT